MDYGKGTLLNEGKTKRIFQDVDDNQRVIIQNKKAITAFDDPNFTKEFKKKGVLSTTTTCRVFELLKKADIPVAYLEQISDSEFLAKKCEMINLEVIGRRLAFGSYLNRHPELIPEKDELWHRFHRLKVEFFLKTTGGKLEINGKTVVDGLHHMIEGEEKTLDDPFISNPYDVNWELFHPKKPSWDPEADLKIHIDPELVIVGNIVGQIGGVGRTMQRMENILRKVFLVLEGAWNTFGLRIIDMKIEFGLVVDKCGVPKIVVSDVIDNDSWRLRDADWQELSKESFRQGEDLTEVERKYGIVASLVDQFRIPKQALVFWKGSPTDPSPNLKIPFVKTLEKVFSGHKSPQKCLNETEKILREYPDGGVIVVEVGRSNGLGPLLAARTNWPVIAIPATMDRFPEDTWSSIRMPSNVPLMTAWPDKNAMLAALNILAQKNPLIYMSRQEEIEELDI